MPDQLNIFDALATLDPTLAFTMEPEPAWVWARCPLCRETRYVRRGELSKKKCIFGCKAQLEVYLSVDCVVCGKPVTARRRDADVRFCSRKCEEAR